MNSKQLDLATRRGMLKARIDEQRRALGQHAVPLQAALARGDSVLKGVDWFKHHPLAIGAAVAAVVVARPKQAWRWAKRGFLIWRGWQVVRSSLAAIR
ncbi:YqjK-like family protein [Dechloromonas denitrificans]|uniref:YqjK-like family protein n=1 Tax=Dechloromonas denitrificans TaxID=281362 RepID=UPI001CF865D5|nr:YqjK-like family protein [Dechloromonas denitrificans]UCV03807.1 YqjK-like family protein [Dechloromonas denitrificans]UCV08070.1 YqjK-like family protein [Dechloromonas denitrificans]